jgi:hypothetical protein
MNKKMIFGIIAAAIVVILGISFALAEGNNHRGNFKEFRGMNDNNVLSHMRGMHCPLMNGNSTNMQQCPFMNGNFSRNMQNFSCPLMKDKNFSCPYMKGNFTMPRENHTGRCPLMTK